MNFFVSVFSVLLLAANGHAASISIPNSEVANSELSTAKHPVEKRSPAAEICSDGCLDSDQAHVHAIEPREEASSPQQRRLSMVVQNSESRSSGHSHLSSSEEPCDAAAALIESLLGNKVIRKKFVVEPHDAATQELKAIAELSYEYDDESSSSADSSTDSSEYTSEEYDDDSSRDQHQKVIIVSKKHRRSKPKPHSFKRVHTIIEENITTEPPETTPYEPVMVNVHTTVDSSESTSSGSSESSEELSYEIMSESESESESNSNSESREDSDNKVHVNIGLHVEDNTRNITKPDIDYSPCITLLSERFPLLKLLFTNDNSEVVEPLPVVMPIPLVNIYDNFKSNAVPIRTDLKRTQLRRLLSQLVGALSTVQEPTQSVKVTTQLQN